MAMEKIKKFVEEHKVQVALAATGVAGIAIMIIAGDKNGNYRELPKPELNTGEWAQLFRGVKGKYKDCVCGVVKAVDVDDLGKFGESLKNIEGIGENEPIRIIFGQEKYYT